MLRATRVCADLQQRMCLGDSLDYNLVGPPAHKSLLLACRKNNNIYRPQHALTKWPCYQCLCQAPSTRYARDGLHDVLA